MIDHKYVSTSMLILLIVNIDILNVTNRTLRDIIEYNNW